MPRAIKELKELVSALKDQGWFVERTAQGHYKAFPADRQLSAVVMSDSGDPHAHKNNLKLLRERGFVWPVPGKKDMSRRIISPLPSLPLLEEQSVPPVPDVKGVSPLEEKMDVVIGELKDSRMYLDLVEKDYRQKAAALESLRKEYEGRIKQAGDNLQAAQHDLATAMNALRDKRRAFDELFDPDRVTPSSGTELKGGQR